ncbi:MAG: hypothetical protein VYE22_29730 [Myxococcota bacterium]|nr:hypothetical protein [Myxococcota bacterium]
MDVARQYGELVALLDEALAIPIPSRFETESRLPGAAAAWSSGLREQQDLIRHMLLTPFERRPLISNLVELALMDAGRAYQRFHTRPPGARLEDLAKAEIASRAASLLSATLNG